MSETYEAILTRMNDTFTSLAGFEPEQASDIGLRMKLLAGEIYALTAEIDWLRQQMFPHTATGEQLDLHAQQRGLTRRKGQKAAGIVVFMLEMPLEYSFVIPAGTICTTDDGALNFVTTQEGCIPQGSTLAWLTCEAEDSGERYNVAHGGVTTIVTYLSVGIRINNSSAFSGGTEDETDESLRQRIMDSYRNTPNGADAFFYERLAEEVEGIQSAKAFKDSNHRGKVIVVLGGRGAAPTTAALNEATALLEQYVPLGISLQVQNTSLQSVNVSVTLTLKNGYVVSDVISSVEERIRTFFADMCVGENFYVASLGKAILETEGVANYTFAGGLQDTTCPDDSYMFKLGTLTVTAA